MDGAVCSMRIRHIGLVSVHWWSAAGSTRHRHIKVPCVGLAGMQSHSQIVFQPQLKR